MRPETLNQCECEEQQPRFWPAVWSSTRPIIRWLALALVLEVFLQRLVSDAWVAYLFGTYAGSSIPLAVVVGAPMYLDGYAALPLVSGVDGQGYELRRSPRANDLRCGGQFLFRGGGRRPCTRPRVHPVRCLGDVRRLPGRLHGQLAPLNPYCFGGLRLTRESEKQLVSGLLTTVQLIQSCGTSHVRTASEMSPSGSPTQHPEIRLPSAAPATGSRR